MLHLDVSTPQGPELYLGMSTIQRPLLVVFRFNANSTNVISFKAISEKSNFLHRLNAFLTKILFKNVWAPSSDSPQRMGTKVRQTSAHGHQVQIDLGAWAPSSDIPRRMGTKLR